MPEDFETPHVMIVTFIDNPTPNVFCEDGECDLADTINAAIRHGLVTEPGKYEIASHVEKNLVTYSIKTLDS